MLTDQQILQQYADCKRRHPQMLLLFKCGDAYKAFGEDAETLATALSLTLTCMDGMFMAGFPRQNLEAYLRRLLHDHRVAICEPVLT